MCRAYAFYVLLSYHQPNAVINYYYIITLAEKDLVQNKIVSSHHYHKTTVMRTVKYNSFTNTKS